MEDDVIGTLPKNILKQIAYSLFLLIIFAIGIQADNKNIPTRENTIERFLTANGILDTEKINQFRSQRQSAAQSVPNLYLDSATSSIWAGDHWEDTLKNFHFYNVSGNLSFSTNQYYWGVDGPDTTDTIINNYVFHSNYSYDDNGRIIERIQKALRTKFGFTFIVRDTMTYDTEGNLIDSLEQFWSSYLNPPDWGTDGQSNYTFTYDLNGNKTEYIFKNSQWDENPPYWKWRTEYREIYGYDVNNNMLESVEQLWDDDLNVWYNNKKINCSYDGSNNLTDSIKYYWDTNQWNPAMKYSYEYDHNDNQILEIHQYDDEGTWINTWKFEYEYDSHGNQTRFFEQYWYGGWDNSWDEVRAYDANDNITENIGIFWNWSSNKWVNYDRLLYTYDLNGNQTEYLEQLWDNNQWNDDIKRTSYYSQLTTAEINLGSDVEITLDEDISILFDSIDVSGLIDITLSENGPESDIHEFLPYDEYDYIFVTTDAEYIGEVELCFPYDDASLTDEQEDKLRVFHYTNNEWMDITTSHDKENDIICGTTVSLSPFAIGREKEPTDIDIINDAIVPEEYTLNQNYPNPFNPSTTIQFSLPRLSKVEIEVYNILGQTVRNLVNDEKPAGQYQVTWDGRDNSGKTVSSGIYFYKIKTDNFTSSKKMLLLK
ncbi:MAG: T9SS type A sorting domain-containing protein [candidate division Zixibacteria bacterium]|nr:T9SS type A sorting domain-containing protein [candidate division Zixibacteria bacterium]